MALPTMITAIAISTLVTGLVFYLLGVLRLGTGGGHDTILMIGGLVS
jgi:hypothetical protein